MFGKIIGLFCLSLFGCYGHLVFGQSNVLAKDSEYQEMLESLNKRYEGFFIHEQEKKRWDSQRRAGIDDVKESREAYEKVRERARKNFVRTPPIDMEPARLRWEAQQRAEEKKREQLKRQFSRKRDEIEKVRSTARQIPPMKEVGLE